MKDLEKERSMTDWTKLVYEVPNLAESLLADFDRKHPCSVGFIDSVPEVVQNSGW